MEIVHSVESPIGSVHPELVPNGGFGRRDAFHVSFDPDEDDVVEEVVRAVAVIHNTDPNALSPLGRVVDPDALEALIGRGFEEFGTDTQVSFVYEDLEITLDTDGNVWLEWV